MDAVEEHTARSYRGDLAILYGVFILHAISSFVSDDSGDAGCSQFLVSTFSCRGRVIDVPWVVMSAGRKGREEKGRAVYPRAEAFEGREFRKPRDHLQFKYAGSSTCVRVLQRTSSHFFFPLICSDLRHGQEIRGRFMFIRHTAAAP